MSDAASLVEWPLTSVRNGKNVFFFLHVDCLFCRSVFITLSVARTLRTGTVRHCVSAWLK